MPDWPQAAFVVSGQEVFLTASVGIALSPTGYSRPEQALRDAKQDLWGARFALSTRQLKDYSTIPQTRRTIARILTVQRERKLGKTA